MSSRDDVGASTCYQCNWGTGAMSLDWASTSTIDGDVCTLWNGSNHFNGIVGAGKPQTTLAAAASDTTEHTPMNIV